MRILILEDEWPVAVDLQGIVETVGHRVVGPVATAVEGLEMVEKNPPDLALLDIRLLDGVSGVTVAKHLKHRWGIPVIFVSASLQEASQNSELAVAVVAKPFSPDMVMDALKVADAVIRGKQPPVLAPQFDLRPKHH